MAIKEAGIFNQQTGVTATSDAIKLRPQQPCTIQTVLTSGSPTTGSKVQITNSPYKDIDAGTALWSDHDGNKTVNQIYASAAANGCMLTGVRLIATDGTWSLNVRQG